MNVIYNKEEKELRNVLENMVFKISLAVFCLLTVFGVAKMTAHAADAYYWGEEIVESGNERHQQWYVQNDAGKGNRQMDGSMPEDLSNATIYIYADPNNDLSEFLKNLKGSEISLYIYSKWDGPAFDYQLGKTENNVSFGNIFFSRKNTDTSLTVNGNIDYQIALESATQGTGDVVINGNIGTADAQYTGNLRLETLWRSGNVTVNGNVNKVYFCEKNADETAHEAQMQYFGTNCTITGSVESGFITKGTWVEDKFEYNTIKQIGKCSAGQFSITNGVLASGVPVSDVEESGYFYFYQTVGTQDANGNYTSWSWMRQKLELNTRNWVKTDSDVSIDGLSDGDALYVCVPQVDVVIDKNLSSLQVVAGTVVFNGEILPNEDGKKFIDITPEPVGKCDVTLNNSMENLNLSVVDNNNPNVNIIVKNASANCSGTYLTKNGDYSNYKYFYWPAGTQLIKNGKWNEDIALTIPGQQGVPALSVKDLPDDEGIAGVAGESEGIGKEFSVVKDGNNITIVKRASTEIKQESASESDVEKSKKALEKTGLTEDKYSVETVLDINILTWYENKTNGSAYNEGEYTDGTIKKLADGKKLTIPFKLESYEEGYDYKVVRFHTEDNGEESEDVLDTNYLGEGWFTFASDRFSKFVIVKTEGTPVKHIPDDIDKNVPEGHCLMYRLYNPNTGEHFYTGSKREGNKLVDVGWNYEGIAWEGPVKSNTPVYRLYNENVGEHHYTTSKRERDKLIEIGWKDEGIGWYSDDNKGTPLYRLYNPNATTGNHHYTKSTRERDQLVKIGWNDEEIGWYGCAQ